MPNKRFWIVAGFLIAGAGVTAVAAHGLKHAHDRGDYGRQSNRDDDGRRSERDFEYGEDVLLGERHGWWRGSIGKEDFDARTRARFASIDANSDSVIDTPEAIELVEKRMQRHDRDWERREQRFAEHIIRRFDVDKDGKVTKAELAGRVADMFARLDLDGDGTIADGDLPPTLRGRDFLRGRDEFAGPDGWSSPHSMRFLRGADANGDGAIALEEAQTAIAKRFAGWDYNRDGVVERSDMQSLRGAFKDYQVKRFLHRFGGAQAGQVTQQQFNTFYAERFAQLDYDNNGELTSDEMPGYGGRMAGHWRHRGDGVSWHRRPYAGEERDLHEENEPGPRRHAPGGTPENDVSREP